MSIELSLLQEISCHLFRRLGILNKYLDVDKSAGLSVSSRMFRHSSWRLPVPRLMDVACVERTLHRADWRSANGVNAAAAPCAQRALASGPGGDQPQARIQAQTQARRRPVIQTGPRQMLCSRSTKNCVSNATSPHDEIDQTRFGRGACLP